MSNTISLIATTFESVINGKTYGKTYGFRMYDSYEKTYDNNSESPLVDDFETLEYAIGCGDVLVTGMIDYCRENEQGININRTWYDYDEIKVYFP